MNVSRCRSRAQAGLTSLEEAVLGLMFEARCNNQGPLKPSDISGYLDIPVLSRGRVYNYSITAGILHRLELEGLVRQVTERGPWVLTDKGICKLE